MSSKKVLHLKKMFLSCTPLLISCLVSFHKGKQLMMEWQLAEWSCWRTPKLLLFLTMTLIYISGMFNFCLCYLQLLSKLQELHVLADGCQNWRERVLVAAARPPSLQQVCSTSLWGASPSAPPSLVTLKCTSFIMFCSAVFLCFHGKLVKKGHLFCLQSRTSLPTKMK